MSIASAASLRTIVIVFCGALVASIWTFLPLQLAHERSVIVQSRTTETANLARVVEEHLVQTLRGVEIALQQMRAAYASQGRRFDLRAFASERSHRADPYNAFGIQDENGDLVLRNTPPAGLQNFRDSEEYQFHARTDTPELFISKPRRGATTGKLSIYLSQRINKRDGSFGGLAVVAIDPDYFSKFYDQIDLGRDDVVNLVGRDGVIRARQFHDQTTSGGDMRASALFTRYLPNADTGSFAATSLSDGIARLFSYRSLRDYPLVVGVGISEAAALAPYYERRNALLVPAIAGSLVIAFFGAWVARLLAQQARSVRTLRDSEERFRSFFERNNAVMTMVHPETGAIENANEAAARFYGYPRETLRTMNIGAINRASPEEFATLRRDVLEGRRRYFVFSHRLADGRVRDVEAHLTPVEYAGRQVLFSINHDITERRAAEEQLRQLNAELEERVARRTEEILEASQELESFSYSVSHDLRTPLRAIIGFSNIVVAANRDKLDTDSIRHLARVQAGAARMAELIDDLLKLAHVSRQELRRQDIDIGAMAGNIVEALSQAHPGREVHVAVQPRLRAHGDPGLVRVALENLIANAWKFTARNPDAAIEIGAEERGGGRAWFVRDNGTGFDMRYVDRLFAPFQRLHGEKEFEGTGIGLSIVKRIIRRHGGQVWVESEEGKGSTFFFTLEPEPAPA